METVPSAASLRPTTSERRHFRKRMLTYLEIDLLVAQIRLDTQPRPARSRRHRACIIVGIVGDGRDDSLQRREPQRQMTGMVLEQECR